MRVVVPFHRRLHFNQVHPYLAVPTCFYLASKVEEIMLSASRVQSFFVAVCKNHSMEPLQWTVEDMLKCENVILDQLDYNLLVFQPSRPLRHLLSLFHLEDFIQSCTCASSAFLTPSSLINDSLFTTIPLLYPPYMVALTAIYMMCIFNSINPEETFLRMHVDMATIHKICSQLCQFYELGVDFWPKSITDSIIVLSQQFH